MPIIDLWAISEGRQAAPAEAGNGAEEHRREDERADAVIASRQINSRIIPGRLPRSLLPAKASLAASRGQRTPAASVSRGRGSRRACRLHCVCNSNSASADMPVITYNATAPKDRPVVEPGRHHDLQQAEDGQLPVDGGLFFLEEQDQLQPGHQVGDDEGFRRAEVRGMNRNI